MPRERVRARAPGLALSLCLLVVAWQAWWQSGFLVVFVGPETEEKTEQGRLDQSSVGDAPVAAQQLPAGLQLVVFDLAGTTLDDLIDGEPLAVLAIRAAFARAGAEVDSATVTGFRGLEKREAIRQLCRQVSFVPEVDSSAADTDVDEEQLVDLVHGYFKEALDEALRSGPLQEVPGASAAFQALRAQGARIFVSSGFTQDVLEEVVGRLGWEVDGIVAAHRPNPDAIFEAMKVAGVQDSRRVLKVGDTVADVEEGRNAFVWTAAVLTGTQGEAKLRDAKPDFLLQSVADIPALLPPGAPMPGPQPQPAPEA